MTALAIRGGHLVDPAAGVDLPKDILLKDGRVAEIAAPGKLKSANGADVLDATRRGITIDIRLVDDTPRTGAEEQDQCGQNCLTKQSNRNHRRYFLVMHAWVLAIPLPFLR